MSTEVIMKREGINTLSIRSYLRAINCVCLKKYFDFDFVMILVSVLKNVYEVFENIYLKMWGVKNICFEKAIKSNLPTQRLFLLFSFSFRIVLSIPLVGR